MEDINELIKQIKKNKKYNSISDDIILDELKKYMKYNNQNKIINNKQIIKEIRSNLHRLYSSYQTKKKNKRNKYLEQLKLEIKNNNIISITKKLLSLTVSTKERLDNYEKIYSKIFEITEEPKTILDLGAGLNLLSFPFMKLKKLTYFSYDIDEEDKKFLNNYFDIMKPLGLSGKAEIIDVRDSKQVSNLPSADVVFIFKTLDLIDIKNNKPSEELITTLFKTNKTKFIVASFATKTLTRKYMNFPKRKGFEFMLERIGLKFKYFSTDNEVFYVIWK